MIYFHVFFIQVKWNKGKCKFHVVVFWPNENWKQLVIIQLIISYIYLKYDWSNTKHSFQCAWYQTHKPSQSKQFVRAGKPQHLGAPVSQWEISPHWLLISEGPRMCQPSWHPSCHAVTQPRDTTTSTPTPSTPWTLWPYDFILTTTLWTPLDFCYFSSNLLPHIKLSHTCNWSCCIKKRSIYILANSAPHKTILWSHKDQFRFCTAPSNATKVYMQLHAEQSSPSGTLTVPLPKPNECRRMLAWFKCIQA